MDGEEEQNQQSAETSRIDQLESRVLKLEQKSAGVKTAASPLKLEAAIRAAFKHIGVDFGKFLG